MCLPFLNAIDYSSTNNLLFRVTSLGQPLEVTKTTMSANRSFGIAKAAKHVWSRGGFLGFYQGLIPWAWIEASTKGAVLVFVASEAEYHFRRFGLGNFAAGIAAGMTGGVAQGMYCPAFYFVFVFVFFIIKSLNSLFQVRFGDLVGGAQWLVSGHLMVRISLIVHYHPLFNKQQRSHTDCRQ